MRTIRLPILLIPVLLFLQTVPARGREQDSQVFAMWDGTPVSDVQLAAFVSQAPSIQPPMVAMASTAGQNENPPDSVLNQVQAVADGDRTDHSSDHSYRLYFGAGASWWQPYRLSDDARSEMVLPEFAVSLSPFGQFMEVGADIAIGEHASMLLRPNLKFYSFETDVVSLYLEGSAALYRCSTGTYWGGGAGIGLMISILEHVSLEIRATAVVFDLSEETSVQMFGHPSDKVPLIKELADLVVLPSVGARTLARF